MTDSEQVYALYVQANPVPDPDALWLTRTEAELLTHERSTEMDTRERIKNRPIPGVAPRRRGLALGLAAVVMVAAVAVGAFLIGGGEDGPVAAAEAKPQLLFDGTACSYSGPAIIEEGSIEFTAINTSDVDVTIGGFALEDSELAAALDVIPLGTDKAVTAADPGPEGTFWATSTVPAGSEITSVKFIAAGGTTIIDCLYYADPLDASPSQVFRAATTFAVVAP